MVWTWLILFIYLFYFFIFNCGVEFNPERVHFDHHPIALLKQQRVDESPFNGLFDSKWDKIMENESHALLKKSWNQQLRH